MFETETDSSIYKHYIFGSFEAKIGEVYVVTSRHCNSVLYIQDIKHLDFEQTKLWYKHLIIPKSKMVLDNDYTNTMLRMRLATKEEVSLYRKIIRLNNIKKRKGDEKRIPSE